MLPCRWQHVRLRPRTALSIIPCAADALFRLRCIAVASGDYIGSQGLVQGRAREIDSPQIARGCGRRYDADLAAELISATKLLTVPVAG